MTSTKNWNEMTSEEREKAVSDFKYYLESDLNIQKAALEKAIDEKPDQILAFVFTQDRFPTIDEIKEL